MIKNTNNNLYNNNSYSKSTYEFSSSFREYNKNNLYKIKEQKIKISPKKISKLLQKKNNKSPIRKISINTLDSNNSNKEYFLSSYISSSKKNSYSKIFGKNQDNSIIHKNKSEKMSYKFICEKKVKKEKNNKYLNINNLVLKSKTFFSNKNLEKNNIKKSPKKNANMNKFNDSSEKSNLNPEEKNIKEYSSKEGVSSIQFKFKAYKKLKNKMKSFNKKNEVRAILFSQKKN